MKWGTTHEITLSRAEINQAITDFVRTRLDSAPGISVPGAPSVSLEHEDRPIPIDSATVRWSEEEDT